MNELNNLTRSERIQAVINTLQVLEMPATFDNCNKMTGIYGDLFLYVNGSDLQTVFNLLIDPEKTKKITYTQVNGEKQIFTGFRRLIAVRDEGNGLITAVLRKEGS